MRASRPKLSGNARIAIFLWLVAIGTAFAIMMAATVKARAAVLAPVRELPEILIIPPAGYLLAALILSSTAIVLAVLAVVLASGCARAPRRGL